MIRRDEGTSPTGLLLDIRLAFRSPLLPAAVDQLARAEGYLAVVWPRIASSVETAGFLGSALYMSDMALDAVEQVYDPIFTRDDLVDAGLTEGDLAAVADVIDVFHYVQPQVLLALAALAEAMDRERVGGQGKPDPRPESERERRHLSLTIPAAPPETAPLPEVRAALGLGATPDLYRALAAWPAFLHVAWEEIQHLVAYPEFRRRGRGLYYYARAGARFLAEPLEANPAALRAAGLTDPAIDEARSALDAALPALAMMMMHTEAMRVGLHIASREVVKTD